MVVGTLDWDRVVELLLGSLLLPALVALLVTYVQMNRQTKREKHSWYDSVEAATSRIEGAWYPEDELTPETLEDTIHVVDSSLEDLKELKGNPEASGKLVDSIEFLNRRWFHHRKKIKKHSNKRYQNIADATQRDCRQIKYIVQMDRPKSYRERLKRRLPQPIDWVKYCRKMGFSINRERLSTNTIEKLGMQLTVEEIKQLENGEKVIVITKPFQTRLLPVSDSKNSHFSVNAFPRGSWIATCCQTDFVAVS
ncbi:hypothetical protein [Natronobeatus ordinarius]|uniref:hypothetical protein n=1 Tax=Natronobeatus ordinarius TaxID=2963433 RepID=UPI0020CE933C|nr:hypothetical protein [Natronobeatus ordinarius]